MPQLNHTPTPWKVGKHSITVFGADGYEVTDPEQGPHVSEEWQNHIIENPSDYRHWSDNKKDWRDPAFAEMEANAEFIVRACNAHDDLIRSAQIADKLIKLIEKWADSEQEASYAVMDDIVALAQDERLPERTLKAVQ